MGFAALNPSYKLQQLRVALRHEAGGFDQDGGALPEGSERGGGLGDQRTQALARAIDAEDANHGGLAGVGILAGLLADQRRIAFDIEEVVGDLERAAARSAWAKPRS